jgi:16S rRNA processing protein RimM
MAAGSRRPDGASFLHDGIVEIAPPAGVMLANAVVPRVDVKGGRGVVGLPEEIEGDDRPDDT